MAQNDGSVVIDTALDNTGFEKGSKKLTQSIRGITQSMNQAGKQSANSMQPIISACQQTAKVVDSTTLHAKDLDSKLSSAVSSSDFGKSMTAAERAVASLEKQIQRLSESERIGVKTGAQMNRFKIKVENARDSVNQLEKEMQTLGTQTIVSPSYEAILKNLDAAREKLVALEQRQQALKDSGVKKSSAAWRRVEANIQRATAEIATFESYQRQQERAGIATSVGSTRPQYSAQYQQMAATLRDMQAQLQRYEAMAADFDTVSGPAARSESSLKKVDAELRQKPKDAGLASKAFSAFGNTLKQTASTALRVSSSLAKVAFKGIAAGAKKATTSISKFFSKSKDGTLTANGLAKALTSVRRMLISRVKERMITMLINSMRTAMTALAKYSSAFNESMSSMKNAATGLGGNLAVTFGNLVNAVAPAITTIINWISKAISYLNAFFAMLSGKSFVTVAKKQTDDYASSLGGAAGAAKDLKKEVYGFDELNKASSDDGGGSGGGGGAGDMFEDVPIASLLPESVQNFFNSIKAAFEAGDWQGIGIIIGEGLNVVVTAVDDWITGIQPVAVEWSSRIAQILNGLVMGFDWANLGSTVANGINTIFAIINTFLTTFDWTALGTALGTGFNSLFNDLDWALIGQTFANKWNALINTIYGFATTVNWSGLGTSIATGVANWFNTINWAGISSSIAVGFNGIITGLSASITATDWTGMGSTLATSVNTVFDSIDWASAGQSISDALISLLASINTFLMETDWQSIGNDVATFLAGIDWSGLVTSISTGVGAALGGLAALIWGTLEDAWNSVVEWWYAVAYEDGGFTIQGLLAGIGNAILGIGQWIVDNIFTPFINGFKAAFGIASPSTVMQEMGGFIIEGLLNGLTAAWDTIVTWAMGIVEDFAGYFSGLWETISTAASTAWEGISTTISGVWDGLSTAATTAWDGIKTTITGVWDGLGTGATQAWDGIKTTVSSAWDSLSTSATTVWNNIKTTVSTVWTNLSTSATTTWENIKTTISTAWDNVSTNATNTWNTISTNLSTTWETVKTNASTAWENVKTTIIDWFTGTRDDAKAVDWSGVGEGITNGTESGITGLWSSFKTRVVNKFKSLVQSVKNTLGIASPSKVFKSIGGYTMMGLNEGIEGKEGTVFRTMSNIANGLSETITGNPQVEIASARVVSSMDAVADKLSSIASTFAAIANVLTAVGGFYAPAVASGTAIPYKARVAAETSHTGNSDPLTAFTTDFDETMSDQMDLLRELIETVRKLRIVIDEKSLEKRITYLQRSRERAYGGV